MVNVSLIFNKNCSLNATHFLYTGSHFGAKDSKPDTCNILVPWKKKWKIDKNNNLPGTQIGQ